ncbi:MAG: hypothetical protein EA379_04235 [Phycisphaerales bacterium]|nr:MAG: hypothetical protein EA379_04235 [Phycisphaerales bacterium]
MAKTRQLVLYRTPATPGAAAPLGTRREVIKTLAPFNTAPDGSPESETVAYGPGVMVQFPYGDPDDELNQVLVAITEEEIAWSVLRRLCRETGWSMMDPDTGRVFSAND